MEQDEIKPEAVLDLFQTVGGKNAELYNVSMASLKERGLCWVLNRIKYQRIDKIKKETIVKINTWPNPKKLVEYLRQFEIYNEEGNLAYIGSTIWLIIDLNNHKIIRNGFDFGDQNDPIFFDIKRIKLDENKFQEIAKYRVGINDIDHLGHMNNTKYARMLYEVYPTIYQELQIDYLKEIKKDDVVTLKQYQENDDIYIAGYVDNIIHFMAKIKL